MSERASLEGDDNLLLVLDLAIIVHNCHHASCRVQLISFPSDTPTKQGESLLEISIQICSDIDTQHHVIIVQQIGRQLVPQVVRIGRPEQAYH